MTESVPSALAPCFMVYPMPSIGDESLLQVIFHHKVARSIFAGYGLRRLAIVELNDAALIGKVCAALEKHAAEKEREAVTLGDVTASALGLEGGSRTTRNAKRKESAALVEDWLDTLVAGASTATNGADASTDGDRLTLADLFAAPPPAQAAVENAGRNSAKASSTGALLNVADDQTIDYITALRWRGHPLHVVVSPVTVNEFYACGGTVPTHAASKKRARDGETDDGANAGDSTVAQPSHKGKRADGAAPHATGVFPKNCCQKCGSPDHFTRKCDGSGPGVGAVAAPEAPVGESASSSTAPNSTAAPAVVFPKNCCQKCGSPDHFTRHCDGSGAAQSPATTTTTTKAASTASPVKAVSVPEAARKLPPTIVRTTKDQCKFCGSADHLSRHCPNK